MSYEHKDTIEDSIIHYYDHVLLYGEDADDVLDELDQVYTQAPKADEYEAKAEAFDAIMREWEDGRTTKSHIIETIQKYYDEYESGESEIK